MSNLDQFESAFRSAAKPRLHYERVLLRKILVVTDLDEANARAFGAQVRAFLSGPLSVEDLTWTEILGPEFSDVGELLAIVNREAPDLICTYRHLHGEASGFEHSLGEYLDVLSQATAVPVLALPHPQGQSSALEALKNTDNVMAITDHLTGSDALVNMAVRFTQPGGTMWLTHIEDEAAFDRVVGAIAKIPSIDTEHARTEIRAQLLKEPKDYVNSCREILSTAHVDVRIEDLVVMGHHLSAYRQLVGEHEVDLLVMNTKDDEQLAMHGMAYPLAIELRTVPLLLL